MKNTEDEVAAVRDAFRAIRGNKAFRLLMPEHPDLYLALCHLVERPKAREDVRRAIASPETVRREADLARKKLVHVKQRWEEQG